LNKERTVKRSVEKQIAVIFGLALPILFVIGTFQYQSVLRLEDTHHQLALRSETLEELRAASALLNLADAASLGSATTAPQGALQAPGSADAARARLQKLRKLTSDNPRQQKRLDALEPLLARRFGSLKVDDSLKNKGSSVAGPPAPSETDPRLAGEIGGIVRGMEAEEQQLLDKKKVIAAANAERAMLMTTLGSAVSVCLVALAGLLLHYYITRSRRAEASHLFSAQLVEKMAAGVCLSDEHGTILYSNPAGEALFGYERGELVGNPLPILSNASPPEERQEAFNEIYEQSTSRGGWRGEFASAKKDGTPFKCYARVSILKASGKQYWLAVQEDVAERKQAEEKPATAPNEAKGALRALEARQSYK
jgi:PAS domain S-box-containing protein